MVKTHGVLEVETSNSSYNSLLIDEINRLGYAVIENFLLPEEVALAKSKLAHIYDIQVNEVGGVAKNLKLINEEGIIRTPLAYDQFFLKKLCVNRKLNPIIEALLDGSYHLYSQVGLINNPNSEAYQFAWHREIQYQHLTTSRPLAIQSIFLFDDFDETNGAMSFIPSSHLFEKFPSVKYVKKHSIQPRIKAGSVFLMNSMLYHNAGVNKSGSPTMLLTNTFTRPVLAQQFQYTKMITNPDKLSKKEKQILGFRWNYSLTPKEWRLGRLKKL
jgi:ectoine hydroxylase-related dioxygenase (phytanoyl-CoA dioxygenase family)